MGQPELAGHQIEHGNEVNGRTIASRFALGGAEHTIQSFHEGVGHSPLPVSQDAFQMVLDHLGQLDHRSQEVVLVKAGGPTHPPAPYSQPMLGRARVGRTIDVIRVEKRLCRVIRVNECAAVILMNRPVRDFKTRFDKPVRFQPPPTLVRICSNSDVEILNRRAR